MSKLSKNYSTRNYRVSDLVSCPVHIIYISGHQSNPTTSDVRRLRSILTKLPIVSVLVKLYIIMDFPAKKFQPISVIIYSLNIQDEID